MGQAQGKDGAQRREAKAPKGGAQGEGGQGVGLDARQAQKIANTTSFTTKEVSDLFKVFRELALKSPSNPNVILKSQFKSALAEAGIDIDNNVYLGSLFNAFDRNETGNIDFREYVLGLSAASKGTVREKISLSFQVYDVDGTGKIDRDEMVKILMSVADHEQKVQGGSSKTIDKKSIVGFVDQVFTRYDRRKNGVLSYDEYMRAVTNIPDLAEFKSDFTILGDAKDAAAKPAGSGATARIDYSGITQEEWRRIGLQKGWLKD